MYPTMTCSIGHTIDHPHTKPDPNTTPEIEATHVHIHPTNHQDEIHISHTHTPVDQEANHITKGTPE